MKSNRFITFIVSIFLLLSIAPKVNACVSVDNGRVWFYLPSLVDLPSLYPYTISDLTYYYDDLDGTIETEQEILYRQNITEWKAALGSRVSASDLDLLLYHTEPIDYFAGEMSGNALVKILHKPSNSDFLKYFEFAKTCESILGLAKDDWTRPDLSNYAEVSDYGEELLTQVNNQWVKNRMAFLLLKLYNYERNKEQGKVIFDKYFRNTHLNSWIQNAAFFQYAGLAPDAIEKNYWLVRAFDGVSGNREAAMILFDEKYKEGILDFTQSHREKAFVYLLSELDYPGRSLENMKRIYEESPDLDELKMLILREINKIEDWLLTEKLRAIGANPNMAQRGFESIDTALIKQALIEDIQYLEKVRGFVGQVIKDNQQKDREFWLISGAYLAFLNADFAQSSSYLSQLNKRHLSAERTIQVKAIESLNALMQKEMNEKVAHAKIIDLYKYIAKSKGKVVDLKKFESQISVLISDGLLQRGDKARAVLMLSRTNNPIGEWDGYGGLFNLYHTMLKVFDYGDYDLAIQVIHHPRTTFDRWLISKPKSYESAYNWYLEDKKTAAWDVNKILDYQGTYAIIKNDLPKALRAFKKIQKSYWKDNELSKYWKRNPFVVGTAMEGVELTSLELKFNKAEFVAKLMELQKRYEANPQDQEAALLLANGYYNMTYHGSWWLMTKPYKSSSEEFLTQELDETDENQWIPVAPSVYPPGIGWLLAIGLLVVMMAFYQKWSVGLKFGLSFVALGMVVYISSCAEDLRTDTSGNQTVTQEESKTEAPKPKEAKLLVNGSFNNVYYKAERAMIWYQRVVDIDADSKMGILASYMVDRAKKRAWFEVPSSFELGKLSEMKWACTSFQDYLKESGKTVD